VLLAGFCVACGGDDGHGAVDAGHDAPVADAPPIDAAPDLRVVSGTHLVAHPSLVAGLTDDGYVVFSDTNAGGYSVAKVIPLAGGDETTIATSDNTGKADIRFAIDGDVVFVFTDRGNRVSNLTIWSAATGVITKGSGARPGRAAASADGNFIAYETDITSTVASLVAGPIDGSASVVDSANMLDNDCWMNTDIESSAQDLLLRYCAGSATTWTLRSVSALTAAGSGVALSAEADEAAYRDHHVVWRDTSGALSAIGSAAAGSAVLLASDATDFVVSNDETTVAWLDTTGAILSAPIDGGSAAPHTLVAAPAAKALGALSPDNSTVLFASQVVDMGSGYVLPYTNVLAGREGASPLTLVGSAESCPNCTNDSFTPDSSDAVVLDPVDNSEAADVAGPIHTFSLADGTSVSSFGQTTWSAVALGGSGSGASSRFVALDAVRDSALEDGWGYEMSLTTLAPSAPQTIIARHAESFVIDAARTHAIASFAGSDAIAGVYVMALQ
jgi:hypothetical protein